MTPQPFFTPARDYSIRNVRRPKNQTRKRPLARLAAGAAILGAAAVGIALLF